MKADMARSEQLTNGTRVVSGPVTQISAVFAFISRFVGVLGPANGREEDASEANAPSSCGSGGPCALLRGSVTSGLPHTLAGWRSSRRTCNPW